MSTIESDNVPTPIKKGRRRRVSRRAGRASVNAPVLQKRKIPAYQLLDEASLAAIEAQADWILENVGVEFRGDALALELFSDAGATVQGERLRFEPGLVRSLCATAPEQFLLHGRKAEHTVTLGGDFIVLMPGYGSPFVTDLDKGRRYASFEDFENFVRLSQLSTSLHHSGGTVCEPTDLPVNKRHLHMIYAHLSLSTKPFMGAVTSVQQARDSIEMARIVFGGAFMREHAVMQGNINVNSPLVFDGVMSGALRVYAKADQCVCVSPAIFGGAMGPVSAAAMTAQTLAEGMVGIALVQLIRPGCPCVLGSFHSTMNLRSGSLTFGTPEANLVTMALSQLGRRLAVPVRSGGGQITAANSADGQAMQDSANAMWATLMSGAQQVWHAAGWLEGGLTMSYEKFIMDLDNCGAMLRMLQGMPVDAESLSAESYLQAGPGENFLSTDHTMRHYATANYESLLPDTGPFERWSEQGSLSAEQRANTVYKEMLGNYQAPELNEGVDRALKEFIADREGAMADEWY